jgi:hypothetical protein
MRLLKAAIFVLPVLLSGALQARADVCTVDSSGKPNLSCNNPALPKCSFNPARQEWSCYSRDTIACGSQYKSWGCPAGSNCNGDGSDPNVNNCRR